MPTAEQTQQLLNLLLGPLGLTVGLITLVILLVTDRLVTRGRLQDKEKDRLEMSKLLDKALSGYEGMLEAMRERTRIDKAVSARDARNRQSVHDEINDVEDLFGPMS